MDSGKKGTQYLLPPLSSQLVIISTSLWCGWGKVQESTRGKKIKLGPGRRIKMGIYPVLLLSHPPVLSKIPPQGRSGDPLGAV